MFIHHWCVCFEYFWPGKSTQKTWSLFKKNLSFFFALLCSTHNSFSEFSSGVYLVNHHQTGHHMSYEWKSIDSWRRKKNSACHLLSNSFNIRSSPKCLFQLCVFLVSVLFICLILCFGFCESFSSGKPSSLDDCHPQFSVNDFVSKKNSHHTTKDWKPFWINFFENGIVCSLLEIFLIIKKQPIII